MQGGTDEDGQCEDAVGVVRIRREPFDRWVIALSVATQLDNKFTT